MTSTSRRLLAVAVAVGALTVPGTALAKGGDGGAPVSTAPAVQCDYSLDGPTADGGYVFSNQVGDAGCLSVVQQASTLRVHSIQVTPGWNLTAPTIPPATTTARAATAPTTPPATTTAPAATAPTTDARPPLRPLLALANVRRSAHAGRAAGHLHPCGAGST